METSDFDLPRYNVNSAPQSAYPMYNQDGAGAGRAHNRLSSSIMSGEQSPTPGGGDSSSIHRSNSLSSSFYPSAVGAYRQDNPQQLHPYQSPDIYTPQDYNGPYAARRQNTQSSVQGVTLSPRSSLRQQQPTSPAISVTMEPAVSSSSYPQQHLSGVGYGAPVGSAAGDSYAPSAVEPSSSYHNHGDAPSPSPPGSSFPPPYSSQQQSLYPSHQQQQPLGDPYSNHPHYSQQQSQDISRSSSSMQHSSSVRASASTPNTPMSHRTYQQSSLPPHSQQGYYSPALDQPPQRRRLAGMTRIRDARELRPRINQQPQGRRMDPNGSGFLSPLKSLTTHISSTYNICNPQFRYEVAHNPRRVLTKPSKPSHNDGYDNEDYDYILYVNDWLGQDEGHNKYLILDILGQGTFGQVVKCQNMKTHEIVAVKVVKNKPAYFNQSMMEVQILKMLNDDCDPHDEHHILRLRETFIHKNHLCLVFELLSSNLYELIKQNQFGGLSTQLVKVFTAQLLDALTVLKEAQLIHCDLKPENILLKSLQAPTIKVIDFGSACHERQTVYTYIQSRFYRSPEVLLGLGYSAAIDMWSLGCIAVELFLGLPLFPGTSEYNQITRIVEMLGMPPTWMLEKGKQSLNFFAAFQDEYGKRFQLKSLEQYSREHGTNEQPGKKYFQHNSLPEIIKNAPIQKSSSKAGPDVEKEMQHRASFIDFVGGLLNLNPLERWTPQQARLHPFITGDKWTKPFVPPGPSAHIPNGRSPSIPDSQATLVSTPTSESNQSAKRPYGGLLPQPAKGARAYQDATSYNQRLAQHQAHIAQQAVQTAKNNAMKNPYHQIANVTGQPMAGANGQSLYGYSQGPGNGVGQPPPAGQYPARGKEHLTLDPYAITQQSQQSPQQRIPPVNSLLATSYNGGPLSATTHQQNPHPPSSSYYPATRGRANTINQMDQVPPQLARAHLDLEAAGMGRNTLTPVINREDAMREWERRQAGGGKLGPGPAYPQLEYLQQQVEMDSSGGVARWGSVGHGGQRYAPVQPSGLAFQAPPAAVVVDNQDKGGNLREAAMTSARTAAGLGGAGGRYDVPAPPQPAYNAGSPMLRYGAGGSAPASSPYQSQPPQGQQAPAYDSFDHRDGIGTLYMPMQPNQFGNYSSQSSNQGHSGASLTGNPPQQSFYGASVVAAGGPSGTFNGQQQGTTKDGRRMSGMDLWSR